MDLVDLYTSDDIASAVSSIGSKIAVDYADKNPLFVGVLTSSFVFVADLIRAAAIPSQVDFIRARSYGTSMESSGAVEITKDIEHDVSNRHVILVEDILDTGLTLNFVSDRIAVGKPASIAACALLTRAGQPKPEYWGIEVPPGFVVGYGIDYAEQYRWLTSIRTVAGTESLHEH
ncbi:MAG: phosphoribosyltransferase family protein [Actinomycetota bacterium]|nr:phosphoribosyltransferase family protein [Actinomycetota bacterium]